MHRRRCGDGASRRDRSEAEDGSGQRLFCLAMQRAQSRPAENSRWPAVAPQAPRGRSPSAARQAIDEAAGGAGACDRMNSSGQGQFPHRRQKGCDRCMTPVQGRHPHSGRHTARHDPESLNRRAAGKRVIVPERRAAPQEGSLYPEKARHPDLLSTSPAPRSGPRQSASRRRPCGAVGQVQTSGANSPRSAPSEGVVEAFGNCARTAMEVGWRAIPPPVVRIAISRCQAASAAPCGWSSDAVRASSAGSA